MEEQSKYFEIYRFDDETEYKVEIGKDGVTEQDMKNLRRVTKSQRKRNKRINKLVTVSIEAETSGNDSHTAFADGCADVELLIETIDEYASLHKAIESLNPEQKDLVHRVFFQNVTARQYAYEMGVSHTLANRRINKALEAIKKFFA